MTWVYVKKVLSAFLKALMPMDIPPDLTKKMSRPSAVNGCSIKNPGIDFPSKILDK
jgi:hypothetical protein